MKFRDKSTGGGSKDFVKLGNGESIQGVFRGEPYEFRQHWVNNRSVLCEGRQICELCKQGDKSTFRFRLNLITQENGAFVAKLFEQGWTVYEMLKDLHENDYDIEKNLLKITRKGQGTETSYAIVPVKNGALSAKQMAEVSKVKLISPEHEQPVEPITETAQRVFNEEIDFNDAP